MGLITIAEFKTYVPTMSSVNDAVLQTYIDAASDAVERFCNRKFAQEDVVERVFSTPARVNRIYLKRTPVQYIDEISIVTIDDQCHINNYTYDDATNRQTLVKCNVGYLVDNTNGVVRVMYPDALSYGGGAYPTQYVVSYRGGYDPIPEPVKLATALFAKTLYGSGTSDSSLKSESVGDYSYTRFSPSESGGSESSISSSSAGMLLLHYQRMGVNGL